VFPVKDPSNSRDIGLIDAKGVGSLHPAQADHGNGVATLGETIREFMYEKMVREVLHDSGVKTETVGSYAVISAGFRVIHADGSSSPAGIYLRQAHDRVPNSGNWLDRAQISKLSKIFAEYGIDPNGNIQGTPNGDIFDFGHFIVRRNMPGIDPKKQVSFDVWGFDESIKPTGYDTRWFYSKRDRPWNWSHDLADAFVDGRADKSAAYTHYENLVGTVKRQIAARHANCKDDLNQFLNAS
jgi:hypothetical protein